MIHIFVFTNCLHDTLTHYFGKKCQMAYRDQNSGSVTHNGPIKPGYYWCEYCERYVVNNAACKRSHNKSITHKANVSKYQIRKKKERIENEQKDNALQEQLSIIKAKAQENYLKNDIQKLNDKSSLQEHVNDQDEVERAKELYGEEFFEEVVKNDKPRLDKTEVYNNFMKSLPTHILARHRQTISEFK